MRSQSERLRVYFDGDCPRCRRFAARHGNASGLTFLDLEAGAADLQAVGVSAEAARRRIHAQDADGGVIVGIDAVAAVWRHRPVLRPLAALLGLPGIHALAARIYDAVAARRRRL